MNNQLIATIRQAIMYGHTTQSEGNVFRNDEVRGAFSDVLTEDEIATLVDLIHPPITHELYSQCFETADKVGNMIGEALHQGLDGWEPDEVVVIERFLQDIAYALSAE